MKCLILETPNHDDDWHPLKESEWLPSIGKAIDKVIKGKTVREIAPISSEGTTLGYIVIVDE